MTGYRGQPRPASRSISLPSVRDETRDRAAVFLVRKHPEDIGGVQRHSARLMEGLSSSFHIERVIWRGPEWGAPLYFPYFHYRAARSQAPLVHCDDAVTALIGARTRSRTGKKVVATVHGLDVILPIGWYQRRLKEALPRIDRLVCVSKATATELERRGIPAEKIEVIPNAAENVQRPLEKSDSLYEKIRELTGLDFKSNKVIFSLGRIIRRKGFHRFAENLFPHLPEECVYVVAGPSPRTPGWIKTFGPLMRERMRYLLKLASGCDTVHDDLVRLSRHPRIFYLNDISEELRNLLFAVSDIFVMPNISVEGDMEGFGIVALEAAVRGVPVVATGIEGITDAVIDGQNGFCVPENDNGRMMDVILSLVNDPERLAVAGRRAREFTKKHYSLDRIVARYEELFESLLVNQQRSIESARES